MECKGLKLGVTFTRCSECDRAEVVRCAECAHLEIVNDGGIYAKCKRIGTVFTLWGLDTRLHYCSLGCRRFENGKE